MKSKEELVKNAGGTRVAYTFGGIEEESITSGSKSSGGTCLCRHCLKKQLASQLEKFPASLRATLASSCRSHSKLMGAKPAPSYRPGPKQSAVPTAPNVAARGGELSIKDANEICVCSQKMYRSLKKVYYEKAQKNIGVKLSLSEQHVIAQVPLISVSILVGQRAPAQAQSAPGPRHSDVQYHEAHAEAKEADHL